MKILNYMLLLIMSNLGAIEFIFEETNQVIITKSESSIKEPSVINDRWQVEHFLKFDNGFGGYITSLWGKKGAAEDVSKELFSGPVNIVHGRDSFYLIYPNTNYATRLQSFWIEKSTKIKNFKTILAIREDAIKTGWISSEKKYRYLIELDDGSHWLTSFKQWPWLNWVEGTHVIFIGNSQRRTLINLDEVQTKPVYVIKDEQAVDVEQL